MRVLGLFLSLAVASAHLRTLRQDVGETQQPLEPGADAESADTVPPAYTGELGPAMPGSAGSCDVMLASIGDASSQVTFGDWVSEVKSSMESNDAATYLAGMRRLCGENRFRPSTTPFQAAIPTDSAQLAGVLDGFGKLGQACSAAGAAALETSAGDTQSQYAAAFNALCPLAAVPGPDMPEQCEFVIASPLGGQASRVQLPLFLEHMRQSLDSNDEAAWLKSLKLFCGAGVSSSGTPWATKLPYPGTSSQTTALKWVDDLRHSCGLEDRNDKLYKAAWDGVCKGAPAGEDSSVAVSCEDTVRIMEKRVTKIQTAIQGLKAAADAASPLVSDKAAQEGLSKAVAAVNQAAQ